nr:putative reverse transcriptase domain-containing protein [Tanacetum cinerariifolium]
MTCSISCNSHGKTNIVADALSRKERAKPRRVRTMSMTIHSRIKAKILEAQSEAFKNTKVGEGKLLGPEVVQELTDKIVQIKERLKPLEFSVSDKVLLKVSTRKGMVRFGERSQLSPRYVGPFKIAKRIGSVTYRLRLPQELVGVHDIFHVSNLKKCLADINLHVPLDEVKVDDKLQFVEEAIEILDRGVKKLKRRWIPIVKVRWNSRRGPEFTWEREDEMKSKYLHLFASALVGQATEISGRNSL